MSEHTVNSTLIEDFIIFQGLLREGDTGNALILSEDLLLRSRSVSERNHHYEARIRMERALIGAINEDKIGDELRWCVDRLNATSPQSSLHGISLLNLASWHLNNSEFMMSLATHAEISIQSDFPEEIVALSRLETSRILAKMNDYEPAMRHAWIARTIFYKTSMIPEFLVSSMEWLDMALDNINPDAPNMNFHIRNAAPREKPGATTIDSNPSDIKIVVEDLIRILFHDLSGLERNDLGLIIDASDILEIHEWKDMLIDRLHEIQDEKVLAALQS